MKKVEICGINNSSYMLKDDMDNTYNIVIEFRKSNIYPKIKDYIYISDKLLDEKMISLGPIGSKYGKQILDADDEDIVVLLINNEKIYLQRYYG